MTNAQIAQLVIAIYLIGIGTVMQTKNIQSALIFRFIPTLSGITLGLIAFGVLQ